MRTTGSRGILAAALLLVAAMLTEPAAAADTHVSAEARGALEQALLERINAVRRMRDLAPLDPEPRLHRAARAYAERMADEGFFDHVSPEGGRLRDRVHAAGYDFRVTAENLAAGRGVADLVVSDWMQSPGHRVNLLRDDVAHLGVGYAYDDVASDELRLRHYWVMLVGTELRPSPRVVLEPVGAPRPRPEASEQAESAPPAVAPDPLPPAAVTAGRDERGARKRIESSPEDWSYPEGE